MVYETKDSALYFAFSTNGGTRFNFNYWRGVPLPTTYLCNVGRAGREGGFICPFFCFSLAGMEFLFPKLVVIIFFFSKEFYYNWRESYLTRCWQHNPKSSSLAEGCQNLHLSSTGFEPRSPRVSEWAIPKSHHHHPWNF
jgi:hypothetical protein